MKYFEWDPAKNDRLKTERGISFEEIILEIEAGNIIDVIDHPNQGRYPGQMIYVINIEEYVFLVPYVESEDMIFLKTIVPSRKATKKYRGASNE